MKAMSPLEMNSKPFFPKMPLVISVLVKWTNLYSLEYSNPNPFSSIVFDLSQFNLHAVKYAIQDVQLSDILYTHTPT